MTDPQTSIQQLLAEAQATANQLNKYSIPRHANMLGDLLIVQKELPIFYFTQAAAENNISPQLYRYWRTNIWATRPDQDENRLRLIVQILTQVYVRLAPYPQKEKYADANKRLRARIKQLQRKNHSLNQIAQFLSVSHHTISELVTQPNPRRPRHCPWAMLEKLQHAEDEMPTHMVLRKTPDRPPRVTPPRPPPDAGLQAGLVCIRPFQNCMKCGSAWSHLYQNGTNNRGFPIFTCRTCGQDNPVNAADGPVQDDPTQTEPPHRRQVIRRYGPCWNCGAPWHNLFRDDPDILGNVIYTCKLCANQNYIAPGRTPATV